MDALSSHDLTILLLSLGVLLAIARLLGEVAQWLHQPAVVGEIVAGLLLGPSVFGVLAPDLASSLFPQTGSIAVVRDAVTTLAITLFLLVAGMEVDLSSVWKQGTTALKVALPGMVVPFIIGLLCGWLVPRAMGCNQHGNALVFALFFGTALSISALPVIAKMLMDLNLYRSDIGMLIISAAILNDLVGWVVFAMTLSLMGDAHGPQLSIGATIAMILIFATGMLTVGRWLIDRSVPVIQAYSHGAGGVLSCALALALIGGAFTEWIGVHAIFGAFLVGVAVGDSSHLRERTRITIDNFVSFVFAPLFFASIGLKVNFISNFEPVLVFTVLIIACIGKLAGCWLGAVWAGLPSRDRWAVGLGMNARGAMEIILGSLALDAGLIGEKLFVALVVMAVVTSVASGPLMQMVLGLSKRRTLANLLSSQRFVHRLQGTNRTQVIQELVRAACNASNVDVEEATRAVLDREETMHTGIGRGIAIPHGRLNNLAAPLIAVGLSDVGVDFDSPDGQAAHVIFLILVMENDGGAQLELIAAIAQAFKPEWVMERILQARNFTELLAVLKSSAVATNSH
ncbi:cation:proton antiporter [Planctomicrobium sp. SH661]|uniref:cation:proton antiporter domain-containing protein n=1 Tax=Planctomicrobium sp. SH661 TaxID=3448124 RepID=UPI003F5C7B07